MRTLSLFGALALILTLSPASAMCGGMGSQASGQASGMSCGRPAQSTQAEDPFGLKVQPAPRQTTMMCPCCRGMAMMQGGGMKMDGDDPHKGMDMSPKQ